MDEKKLGNALTEEQQPTMQEGELTDEALDAVSGGKDVKKDFDIKEMTKGYTLK